MFGQELARARHKLECWQIYKRRALWRVRFAESELAKARGRVRKLDATMRRGEHWLARTEAKLRGQVLAAERTFVLRNAELAAWTAGVAVQLAAVDFSSARYRASYLGEVSF